MKKRKQPSKRKYPVFACTETHCEWKGTRPEKHLASKVHGYEKNEAKRLAKLLKIGQSQSANAKQSFGRNMHTANSLSEEFLVWFESIEGGHYVHAFADDAKRAEKKKQNKKYQGMVCKVLKTFFGEEPFHKSALENIEMIEIDMHELTSIFLSF